MPTYRPRLYSHFQLIAHHVTTVAPVDPGLAPALPARFRPPVGVLGDALVRLTRLAALVDAACTEHARPRYADNARTLKIFMVPEFYFRPTTGPSSSHSYAESTTLLAALWEMFRHRDFRDWLFVPGTIFWSLPDTSPVIGDPPLNRPPLFFNTVAIVKGGPDGPNFFAHKRLISRSDGAPRDRAALLDPYMSTLLSHWEERRKNIFKVDFRTLGVEICFDHDEANEIQTLRKLVAEMAQRSGAPVSLSLHLLTACGMDINSRSTAAAVGKHIIRVEGQPQMPPFSEIRRVTAQDPDLGATLSNRSAADTPLNQVVWQLPIAAPPLKIVNDAGRDRANPQELVCYARQPL